MAANPSQLGSVEYADESSFGEDVATFDARLPALGRVDVSGLVQPKVDVGIIRQYLNEGVQPIRGPMGGSVTLEFMLPGLGSSQSGATSSSDMATFLGLAIGNEDESAASGTTVSSGTSASEVETAASGTFAAGSICRIGAAGDTRGGGHAYAVDSHSGTTLTLKNACIGTPASPDVVYTGRNIYPSESPTTAGDITSIRLGLRTANQQYILHGCYKTGVEIPEINTGMMPKVRVTFAVAWWETANDTFPVATAMQTHSGYTVAGGSVFYNTKGTATRSVLNVRDIALAIDMESRSLEGPGGVDTYQSIVGARQLRQQARISLTVDADAAGTNAFDDLYTTDENDSTLVKHLLYTFNLRNGATGALYFPNLVLVDPRPVQTEMNGLNVIRVNFRADTDTSGSTDLERSSWRLYMG